MNPGSIDVSWIFILFILKKPTPDYLLLKGKIMRRVIKLTLSLLICFSVLCCRTTKLNVSTDNISGYMMNQFDTTFTVTQFDSICGADKIDNNLRNWHKFSYIDFEDRDTLVKYIYVKEFSETNEIIYILTPRKDGNYIISKRIVNPDSDD